MCTWSAGPTQTTRVHWGRCAFIIHRSPFTIHYSAAPFQVILDLASCDGTLHDVRREVQRGIDAAPSDFTFLFDGIPVSREQEREVHAVNCDHIILRVVPDRQVKYSTISDQ